eukprot:1188664-Prorocentrum_minimum.AAC.6
MACIVRDAMRRRSPFLAAFEGARWSRAFAAMPGIPWATVDPNTLSGKEESIRREQLGEWRVERLERCGSTPHRKNRATVAKTKLGFIKRVESHLTRFIPMVTNVHQLVSPPVDYIDIVDPMNGAKFVKCPNTKLDELQPFKDSLAACPKTGLHNPFKNNQR